MEAWELWAGDGPSSGLSFPSVRGEAGTEWLPATGVVFGCQCLPRAGRVWKKRNPVFTGPKTYSSTGLSLEASSPLPHCQCPHFTCQAYGIYLILLGKVSYLSPTVETEAGEGSLEEEAREPE